MNQLLREAHPPHKQKKWFISEPPEAIVDFATWEAANKTCSLAAGSGRDDDCHTLA
jgi:hypothetical protein